MQSTNISDCELDQRIERALRRLGLLAADQWLTPGQAAERAKVSRGHLLRLIRQGQGPTATGAGKLLRIKASAVDAWLENLRGGPTNAE